MRREKEQIKWQSLDSIHEVRDLLDLVTHISDMLRHLILLMGYLFKAQNIFYSTYVGLKALFFVGTLGAH